MMMTMVVVGAAVACGKGDSEPESLGSGHGQCASRVGATFVAHYVQRPGGTCGVGADRIIHGAAASDSTDAAVGDGGSPACSGFTTPSADNCESDYDNTCADDGVVQGGKSRVAGHAEWSTDSSHATAVEQWTAVGPGGQVICNSTYDVTFTRQ